MVGKLKPDGKMEEFRKSKVNVSELTLFLLWFGWRTLGFQVLEVLHFHLGIVV